MDHGAYSFGYFDGGVNFHLNLSSPRRNGGRILKGSSHPRQCPHLFLLPRKCCFAGLQGGFHPLWKYTSLVMVESGSCVMVAQTLSRRASALSGVQAMRLMCISCCMLVYCTDTLLEDQISFFSTFF